MFSSVYSKYGGYYSKLQIFTYSNNSDTSNTHPSFKRFSLTAIWGYFFSVLLQQVLFPFYQHVGKTRGRGSAEELLWSPL